MAEIKLNGLKLSHFSSYFKSGARFLTLYVMIVFCIQYFELRDGCSFD